MPNRRKEDQHKLSDLSADDLRSLIHAIMHELARRDHMPDEPGTTQMGLDYLDDLDDEEDNGE